MKERVVPVMRGVVLACAVVLSFSALHDLAVLCGWGAWQAKLFPVMIDAGVGIALVLKQRRLAWGLVTTTILGNATAHVLVAYGLQPHWVIVVIAGAIAPVVAVKTWHLEDQVVRSAGTDQPEVGAPGPARVVEVPNSVRDTPDTPILEPVSRPAEAPVRLAQTAVEIEPDEHLEDLLAWISEEGATPSRNAIMKRYSVGTNRANRLLAQVAQSPVEVA